LLVTCAASGAVRGGYVYITGKRTKPTHMVFVVMHSVHNRRLAWLPLVTKPISSFAAKSASSLLVSVERANIRPNGAKFPYSEPPRMSGLS